MGEGMLGDAMLADRCRELAAFTGSKRGALMANVTLALFRAADRLTAHTSPAVPDPTVEALSEAVWSGIKSVAFKSIGCNGYGSHGWRSDALRREVERILAARAAAPDALRVRVEALAAEWEAEASRLGITPTPYIVVRLRALLEETP